MSFAQMLALTTHRARKSRRKPGPSRWLLAPLRLFHTKHSFSDSTSCLMPLSFQFAGISKLTAAAALCFLPQNCTVGCFCGSFQSVEQYWLKEFEYANKACKQG